eukprot:9343108-Lingulodinium_polyedra.AAC.1
MAEARGVGPARWGTGSPTVDRTRTRSPARGAEGRHGREAGTMRAAPSDVHWQCAEAGSRLPPTRATRAAWL